MHAMSMSAINHEINVLVLLLMYRGAVKADRKRRCKQIYRYLEGLYCTFSKNFRKFSWGNFWTHNPNDDRCIRNLFTEGTYDSRENQFLIWICRVRWLQNMWFRQLGKTFFLLNFSIFWSTHNVYELIRCYNMFCIQFGPQKLLLTGHCRQVCRRKKLLQLLTTMTLTAYSDVTCTQLKQLLQLWMK